MTLIIWFKYCIVLPLDPFCNAQNECTVFP